MQLQSDILIGYGIFLAFMLIINLLYFFQVFTYRLPGDASLKILTIHLVLLLGVIFISSIMLFS